VLRELYETHLQQFLKALCRVSANCCREMGKVLFMSFDDIFRALDRRRYPRWSPTRGPAVGFSP